MKKPPKKSVSPSNAMTKAALRKGLRHVRRDIENKEDKDGEILLRLRNFDVYQNAATLLCYASLPEEISTDALILYALQDGKRVALPHCSDNDGHMQFYLINSMSDLKEGSFGVREPEPEKCRLLTDFEGSVCIVPAIAYDLKGYRLGYGKGYYDRFLKNYPFISVGLCYNSLVQNELPADGYDIPVNYIITETHVITTENGGKNG